MTTRHSVLITGGTSGIGRALAERYHRSGCSVTVTGRSAERLDSMTAELPGVRAVRADMGSPYDRQSLANHVRSEMPDIDTVINNAGIQRRISLADDEAPWSERQTEIDILFAGPVHLDALVIPVLLSQGKPTTIVNVTSGGALVPQPFAPVYSACKSALHSYTMNLRFALEGTSCRVIEIIPPAVATDLAGPGQSHGAPLADFADTVFDALISGHSDVIGFGVTDSPEFRQRLAAEQEIFQSLWSRFSVTTYRDD